MTTTYKENRHNARKAHAEVKRTLENFAKRSKHITFKRMTTFWGFARIDLQVTGESKVVDELMIYLCDLCPFYELGDPADEISNSDWFHNYDNSVVCDDEDDWAVKYEICVAH